MKFKELRSLDDKSLMSKLDELKMDLLKENSQVATGTTPKSPGHLKEIKKTIARINTVLNERSVTE
jgi:large subunit ribosomal protein L29